LPRYSEPAGTALNKNRRGRLLLYGRSRVAPPFVTPASRRRIAPHPPPPRADAPFARGICSPPPTPSASGAAQLSPTRKGWEKSEIRPSAVGAAQIHPTITPNEKQAFSAPPIYCGFASGACAGGCSLGGSPLLSGAGRSVNATPRFALTSTVFCKSTKSRSIMCSIRSPDT
jgi:hypothetical protein